ncbi:cysteine hydrolase family protein [Brevibacillus daliensis]|uniref:cysteine hydrolase family protein n=1 Tax=Brevibacillus daliensis TaxID=2892995 RepID=UPI001E3DA6F7|nr:cysteine hydrolase family protein [Brevibacillus daliensis]
MSQPLKKPALIIIDVQKGFEDEKWGERNNHDAEQKIFELLTLWRQKEYPIIHIQHLSQNPSSCFYPSHPGVVFQEIVQPLPHEIVIQKNVNSAFIGTNLEEYLHSNDIQEVVIVGMTTPHCVSTTTRMSGNLGFTTYLVSDATAAFGLQGFNGKYLNPDVVHEVTLGALHNEFATVLPMQDLLPLLAP